jgi:hypothetical protein
MQSPPQDPPVDDVAPTAATLTGYDERHAITYLRLLDAEAAGADWRDVAKIVLHIDPVRRTEFLAGFATYPANPVRFRVLPGRASSRQSRGDGCL